MPRRVIAIINSRKVNPPSIPLLIFFFELPLKNENIFTIKKHSKNQLPE